MRIGCWLCKRFYVKPKPEELGLLGGLAVDEDGKFTKEVEEEHAENPYKDYKLPQVKSDMAIKSSKYATKIGDRPLLAPIPTEVTHHNGTRSKYLFQECDGKFEDAPNAYDAEALRKRTEKAKQKAVEKQKTTA